MRNQRAARAIQIASQGFHMEINGIIEMVDNGLVLFKYQQYISISDLQILRKCPSFVVKTIQSGLWPVKLSRIRNCEAHRTFTTSNTI